MAVMARESWTDERIDDLKEQMNERFDQVDGRFGRVEAGMNERFNQVDARFGLMEAAVNERFNQVDSRFGRVEGDIKELRVAVTGMQRTMTQSVIAICTIMLTGFGILIGLAAF